MAPLKQLITPFSQEEIISKLGHHGYLHSHQGQDIHNRTAYGYSYSVPKIPPCQNTHGAARASSLADFTITLTTKPYGILQNKHIDCTQRLYTVYDITMHSQNIIAEKNTS